MPLFIRKKGKKVSKNASLFHVFMVLYKYKERARKATGNSYLDIQAEA